MIAPVPIRFDRPRPRLLAGLRRHHRFADAATGIPAQWAEFLAAPPRALAGRETFGLFCGHDVAAQVLEYMCATEVEDFAALPVGTGRLRLTDQRCAVFACASVAASGAMHQAVTETWFPASGLVPARAPEFELYPPDFDGGGGFEIWTPVAG